MKTLIACLCSACLAALLAACSSQALDRGVSDGAGIDPHGTKAGSAGVIIDPNGHQVSSGTSLDPSGRSASSDGGVFIDPFGGAGTDGGGGMDPNG